jgi:hypothetical protein
VVGGEKARRKRSLGLDVLGVDHGGILRFQGLVFMGQRVGGDQLQKATGRCME